jgi:hypothetical protein
METRYSKGRNQREADALNEVIVLVFAAPLLASAFGRNAAVV